MACELLVVLEHIFKRGIHQAKWEDLSMKGNDLNKQRRLFLQRLVCIFPQHNFSLYKWQLSTPHQTQITQYWSVWLFSLPIEALKHFNTLHSTSAALETRQAGWDKIQCTIAKQQGWRPMGQLQFRFMKQIIFSRPFSSKWYIQISN